MLPVRALACVALAFLTTGLTCATAVAQELVPRAYWPAPDGTKVVGFAYQYSAGDVLVDPSLPVTGVDSKIQSGSSATRRCSLSPAGRPTCS